MRHKHPEITDPVLRQIFAKELWVLRSAMHKTGISMQSEWVYGIRLGFETALRRVQAWQEVNHA
jgi:hypothetical protein